MPRWLRRLLGRPQTEEPRSEGGAELDPVPPSGPTEPEPPPAPPTPLPTPEPEPAPPPAEPEPPPAAAAPGRTIHVYADRLEERPGPRQLTPSEAMMLASDGPEALRPDPEERRGSAR